MPLIDRSSLNKQWETEMLEDLLQLDKNDIEEAIAQMEYNAEILE
jgi:hypothetical protein